MFTGIIETIGTLEARAQRAGGERLTISHQEFDAPLKPGDSIAVAGACLTVAECETSRFAADVSSETLQCTTLGAVTEGARVNLERALKLGDRLGGHLVTGHVDAVGEVISWEPDGDNRRLGVRLPPKLAQYTAVKGSITVNGVSLTINAAGAREFEVNLVPHTLASTTLAALQPGDRVNLEVDLIARYLARLMHPTG